MPSAFVTGCSLTHMLRDGDSTFLISVIVDGLILIGNLTVSSVMYSIFGEPPFISLSSFAVFHSGPFIRHIFSSPLFFLLSHLNPTFDDWFIYLVILLDTAVIISF